MTCPWISDLEIGEFIGYSCQNAFEGDIVEVRVWEDHELGERQTEVFIAGNPIRKDWPVYKGEGNTAYAR